MAVIVKFKFDKTVDTMPNFNVAYDHSIATNELYYGIAYSDSAYTGYETSDIDNGDGTITRTISHTVLPTRIDFNSCIGLLEVIEMNTSNLITMAYLFNKCEKLHTVNCANWDVSKVQDLGRTFSDCYALTSIDLTNWDISNVQSLFATFDNSYNLEYLGDLSGWNTSKVQSMYATFDDVVKILDFNIGNWDTSNVVIMRHMFAGNNYGPMLATNIDVSNWDTSKVTDMQYMFYYCSEIESLDLSNFDTSQVTNMNSMFEQCESLKELDLSNFDTSQITDMENVFTNCESLEIVKIEEADTDTVNAIITELPNDYSGAVVVNSSVQSTIDTNWNVINPDDIKIAEYTFNSSTDTLPTFNDGFTFKTFDKSNDDGTTTRVLYGKSLPTSISFEDKTALLSVNELEISGLTSMSYLFSGCTSLASINMTDWDTKNITSMDYMFNRCSGLTTIDVSSFNTSKVTNMSYMFNGCNKLTSLDINNFDTKEVTNMSNMLSGLYGVYSLDLSNFDTSKVTDMSSMFYYTDKISSLDVSSWDVSKVTTFKDMFANCLSLVSLDLSAWDTSSATNMANMFQQSRALASLNISNFNTENVTTMTYMFYGCSALTTLDANCLNTSNVTDMQYMFGSCDSLITLEIDNFYLKDNAKTYSFMAWSPNISTVSMRNSDLTTVYKLLPNFPAGTVSNPRTLILSSSNAEIDERANNKNWNVKYKRTIAEYITNNVNSLLPTFNSDFEYEYTDVDNGDNTYTRTITSYSQPTSIKFSNSTSRLIKVNYLDIGQLTSFNRLFYNCSNLTEIDVSNWDTSKITDMSYMFYYCSKLIELDVSNWNVSNVTNMNQAFYCCYKLESLDVSNWNVSNVTTFARAFQGLESITELDVSNWTLTSATDISYLFCGLKKLSNIDISKWTTSTVQNIEYLFASSPFTSIDLSELDFTNVTKMACLFNGCNKLETVNLGNHPETSVLNSLYQMFYNCKLLKNVTGYFNVQNVTTIQGLFGLCEKLEDASFIYNWNFTDKLKTINDLFYNCKSLKNVDLSFLSNCNIVSNVSRLFYYCYSLETIDVSPLSNTSANITNTNSMFYYCLDLKEIHGFNGWDTSKLTNMYSMFYHCNNLRSLDINYLETNNVTSCDSSLLGCKMLKQIDLSTLNLEKSTDLGQFIYLCKNLRHLYLNDAIPGTLKIQHSNKLSFVDCTNMKIGNVNSLIKRLPYREEHNRGLIKVKDLKPGGIITNVPTSLVAYNTDGSQATYHNPEWSYDLNDSTSVTFYPYKSNSVKIYYTFDIPEGEYNSITLNYKTSSYYSSYVTLSYYDRNGNLIDSTKGDSTRSIDITNTYMDVLGQGAYFEATSTSGTSSFPYDISIKDIWIELESNSVGLDSDSADNKGWNLIYDDTFIKYVYDPTIEENVLPILDISDYSIEEFTDEKGLIHASLKATTQLPTYINFKNKIGLIDVQDIYLDMDVDCTEMFSGCINLKSISKQRTPFKPIKTDSMFKDCTSLEDIDIKKWITHNLSSSNNMFDGCTKLTKAILSDMLIENTVDDMFNNCTSLNYIELDNSDSSTINKIIEQLPIRSSEDPGKLFVRNVYDGRSLVNETSATNKFWNIDYIFIIAELVLQEDGQYNDLYPDTKDYYDVYSHEETITNNGDGTITKVVYSYDELPIRCRFTNNSNNAPEIIRVNYCDLSDVTNISSSFEGTSNVEYVKLVNMNNVIDMEEIFKDCSNLKTLEITGGFIGESTSSNIFLNCDSLELIKLDDCDTETINKIIEQVPEKNMASGKIKIDIDSIDDLNLNEASNKNWVIIYGDVILRFTFNKDIDTIPVFNDEFSASYIDTIDSENIIREYYSLNGPASVKFIDCNGLISLDYLNANNIIDISHMFEGCINLISINLDYSNIKNITNTDNMFSHCESLTTLDLTTLDLNQVNSTYDMFAYSSNLKRIQFNKNTTFENLVTAQGTFYQCNNLNNLDMSNWNLNKINNIAYFLDGTILLTNIIMKNCDINTINKIIDVLLDRTGISSGCISLSKNININEINVQIASNKNWILYNTIIEYKIMNKEKRMNMKMTDKKLKITKFLLK